MTIETITNNFKDDDIIEVKSTFDLEILEIFIQNADKYDSDIRCAIFTGYKAVKEGGKPYIGIYASNENPIIDLASAQFLADKLKLMIEELKK